jgi:catechol 2,3-dioxygenase-like lactoylglutathione lyase family enzyme
MTLRVMHIAELGLRVTDLPRAVAFYQEVLGLEIVRTYPTIMFLKAGELDSPLGRGGHPQLLVLFDRKVKLDIALTTVDHFAFEIPLEQYPTERERLEQMGLELTERIWQGEDAWLKARSLFFDDPDGNTIELIAHDPNAANEMESS